jgi:hypothetical protein
MNEGRAVHDEVVDWLLQGDPAVRWQAMRDLTNFGPDVVDAERRRVATEGWGAQLLALQRLDGTWGGTAWNHGWDSTMHVLWLLRLLGLEPTDASARQAVTRVAESVTWRGAGPAECDHHRFFEGEIEPCINAQVVTAGAYFGVDVEALVLRLLGEQLGDGGWNCEAWAGSIRSSFNTTICVLEALLAYERSFGERQDVTAARVRGEQYLLERRLFRRRSTGEVITRDRKSGTDWSRFAFPTWWHYDVLRGLDYLREAGLAPDARAAEAVALVEAQRGIDGRWTLNVQYEGAMPVDLGERIGEPSRWITLRALRVLRWFAGPR